MSNTVSLKFPITIAGAEVKTLKLRRAKGADILAARAASGGDELKMGFHMIANLAQITFEDVCELDAADLKTVQEKLGDFF
jgi:hypothetical protein